ncbi:MAG: hypothetical protein AB8I08_05955 [Sandaracinaceae bacterium]
MRYSLPLAFLLLVGCVNNVGPDGRVIGAPCNDELDCLAGSFCIRRGSFPDGMCSTVCDDDTDCRGSTVCVEIMSGACVLDCETDEDCTREGYVCRPQTRRGVVGEVMGCIGTSAG